MNRRFIYHFLQLESASGFLLLTATILAMCLINSPLAHMYQFLIDKSLFWINDGLMTIFFLVIGLELKRELKVGHLADFAQVRLSAIAALGGMIAPGLIYFFFNYPNPITIKAWATPLATDIAFALGVLSLFGRRVPITLKLFLLALAIFDDLGAIIIIALFYSQPLSFIWLLMGIFSLIALFLLQRWQILSFFSYIILGVFLWLCIFYSGIHPTLAGVLFAAALPSDFTQGKFSLVHRLETTLHPWAIFVIMPIFALANAGIPLTGLSGTDFLTPVVLGVSLGLFLGKQCGVFAFSWLCIQCGWAVLPKKVSWPQLYGVSLLCGIGFTMSLFLGNLSFQTEPIHYLTEVRLGVIVGSMLSGLTGAIILWKSLSQPLAN